jgi:hypothetical protein
MVVNFTPQTDDEQKKIINNWLERNLEKARNDI